MLDVEPLNYDLIPEVPLPRTPLVRVIARIDFPPIMAIRNPDNFARFQEDIRKIYPYLTQGHVHEIEINSSANINFNQDMIWHLSDKNNDRNWQVSLAVNFVTLEAFQYENRQDFLSRLSDIVIAVEKHFQPIESSRFGLRYIDRLVGSAADQAHQLLRPEIMGIPHVNKHAPSNLYASIIHLMNQTEFLCSDDDRVSVRWGKFPAGATYDPKNVEPIDESSWILDFDMYTSSPILFSDDILLKKAKIFAECIYWIFRQMITDDFLQFFGGKSK